MNPKLKDALAVTWVILSLIFLGQLILKIFTLAPSSEYDYMYILMYPIISVLIILTIFFLTNMFYLYFRFNNFWRICSLVYFIVIFISSIPFAFISKNWLYIIFTILSAISFFYLLSYNELKTNLSKR